MSRAKDHLHAAALELFVRHRSKKLSISELARTAGVSRGTVYNNILDLDALFDDVVANIADQMEARISSMVQEEDDPAVHYSYILRAPLQRIHQDPNWERLSPTSPCTKKP